MNRLVICLLSIGLIFMLLVGLPLPTASASDDDDAIAIFRYVCSPDDTSGFTEIDEVNTTTGIRGAIQDNDELCQRQDFNTGDCEGLRDAILETIAEEWEDDATCVSVTDGDDLILRCVVTEEAEDINEGLAQICIDLHADIGAP